MLARKSVKILIGLALCLLPLSAEAVDTITFGNSTNGGTCAPCSSVTFALDVGASSSRMLFVSGKSPADDIIAVEYAGVSSTLVDEQNSTGGLGGFQNLYYHIAPTTGSNNVVITANGSVEYLAWGASSYWNVNQVAPPYKAKGVCDSTTACNASGTTVVDGSWIYGGFTNQTGACTAGSGSTLRHDNGAFATCSGDSGVVASPTTDNVNMTIALGGNWAWVNAVFEPSGQAPAAVRCIRPGSCH